MTRDQLKWPNLTQLGTMEASAIALLFGITSGIALAFSEVVAAVLFVPFALWIFFGVLVGFWLKSAIVLICLGLSDSWVAKKIP